MSASKETFWVTRGLCRRICTWGFCPFRSTDTRDAIIWITEKISGDSCVCRVCHRDLLQWKRRYSYSHRPLRDRKTTKQSYLASKHRYQGMRSLAGQQIMEELETYCHMIACGRTNIFVQILVSKCICWWKWWWLRAAWLCASVLTSMFWSYSWIKVTNASKLMALSAHNERSCTEVIVN